MTYRAGWSVIEQMLVQRERWPGGENVRAIPLVYPGQEVLSDQPILCLEHPGRESLLEPSHSSESLPMELSPALQRERNNSHAVVSAAGAEILPAGINGRVVDITRRGGVIIESHAAIVQGVIGVGNQVAGVLTMWQIGGVGRMPPTPAGAILVVPGPINLAFLRQALLSGIRGMIASSMELRDLEGFLQTDLISLLDYNDIEQLQNHLPPITLCLTEGLGNLTMPARVMNLLTHYQGAIVLFSGITSTRQGIVPELVISLPKQEVQHSWHPVRPDLSFVLGAQVRVCAGEHEGKTAIIDYFFVHQQILPSGMHERAARLRCEDGSSLIIPLKLLERIGP
jgi:hypothetical protein